MLEQNGDGPDLIAPQIPEGMKEEIRAAINKIMSRSHMEAHCTIPPETRQEFIDLEKEKFVIHSKVRAIDAKFELFWTQLEERLGIYDRAISFDLDKNLIMVEKEKSPAR